MFSTEDTIFEIALSVTVSGEEKELAIPVPHNYDGEEIAQIVEGCLEPDDDGVLADAGDWTVDDGTLQVVGAMAAETFEDWSSRAKDLHEIDGWAFELDDLGLTTGIWPGALDDRTLEPSELMLDETIEHDLFTVNVVADVTKASFRSMREACGASQAALAEALG
ncbi:MAG: hypothetical protein IJF97_02710, partial [Eggerthellaceae bacterium]|nr:hypothetical protein [Eggerthellaceae bacterium]